MGIGLVIIFTSLISSIATYVDKFIVENGISRKDYFYYMCLSMIPFAVVMCFFETIKFKFSIIPILLLIIGMILRYIKQHTIVGCYKYLNPHEVGTYMTISLVIAFIIDCIFGISAFNVFNLIAIFITIVGVFLFANVKLNIGVLRKDLIIKIICDVAMGYIAYFILKYWSNAIYILILNLMLTIIFTPTYKIKYHVRNIKIIKLVFLQQSFGFFTVYLGNYLASQAVTYSQFVKPLTLILTVLLSYKIKIVDKKPKLKDIFAIVLVVMGVVLIRYK